MVLVCTRRYSDSQFSRAIQDAIKSICSQKQSPNEERILKFVMREFDWKASEISRQLRLCVKDGLLREITAMSHRGSSKGAKQTSFRNNSEDLNVNQDNKPVQTHDWYCFDCQESGEVALCDYCPRVFHKKCARAHYLSQDEQWKCPSCKAAEEQNSMSGMSKEQINCMLQFTVDRLKEKYKDLKKSVSLEEYPDYESYIFHPTDLSRVEMDIRESKFISPGQFLEEIKWLLHNAIIYFGDDDELTGLAEELVEDTKQEVDEMLLCSDCYVMSNTKPKNWFCKPCNPPHELVWAKMSGQPPWPAKVLKWNEDKTKGLVRFFEARHQRAWVYFRHISPITAKPDVKKRPRQWLDAQQELDIYQQQLREMNEENKPKTEPDQNVVGEVNGAETPSEEQCKCLASVSCQTEEDPNKAVIDKLRKRIDDLEQDLRETKNKLNLQKMPVNGPHLKQDGKILTFDTKNKVQKFIASLSEQLKKNIGRADQADEQIKKYVEKEQSDYYQRLDELKKKAEEEKSRAVEELKAALLIKHDSEIAELRETARLERERLEEDLKNRFEEEKRHAVETGRIGMQRKYEDELKRTRETSMLERERVVAEMKRERDLVLREAVRETKRKQWCCNCEQEAFYPCCWNTSYCSRQCQVIHWQQHRLHCNRNFVYLSRPTRN